MRVVGCWVMAAAVEGVVAEVDVGRVGGTVVGDPRFGTPVPSQCGLTSWSDPGD